MSAVGGVFGARARTGSKLNVIYDADGNEIEVETREDEEQHVKLTQIVELLLAAGYFRARIKGLSPFDKVVGGMTWCITTCNFDIDVDLLFQENSTIGQKIALTEKIVAVLPRMMCPHRIEPHQIQGLDFIHIYPVVQWLVKKAIETREEMGDFIRQYAVSQFQKNHLMPEDEAFMAVKQKAVETVSNVKNVYQPVRKYRRHDAGTLTDEESRVHSTLLEYGRRYGLSRSSRTEKGDVEDVGRKAIAAGLGAAEDDLTEEQLQEQEELRIQSLMSGLSAMGTQQAKLTASAVGSIVGMQSAEIQQIASEYADKGPSDLKQAELGELAGAERVGGVQQHKRLKASLQKQMQQQQSKMEEVKAKHADLEEAYTDAKGKLREAEEYTLKIDQQMEELGEKETEANQGILHTLRDLVALNENLRKQEQQFRAHCKEEMGRLQESIANLKMEAGGLDSDEQERATLIERQYEADRDKLHKIRLLLARKIREISALQRKIDEVPSRAELSQYQRRFIELYNQVAATHKETKQFYTLYNTLDDTKLYLSKEVNLLNSIHDNFEQAMASAANRDQFLKQFEAITEGVRQNRTKLEKKKQEEKMKRDQYNDTYLDLIEEQRLYFKTVKDFKEECRKNEILLAKLKR